MFILPFGNRAFRFALDEVFCDASSIRWHGILIELPSKLLSKVRSFESDWFLTVLVDLLFNFLQDQHALGFTKYPLVR